MTSLPGDVEAAEYLKKTALRDFGPVPEGHDQRAGSGYKLAVSSDDAPVPALLKYALTLIGLEAHGPGEKVAWWVNFSYRGESCELAYEKFGVRLRLRTEAPEDEAGKTLARIVKKLRSAIRTVEKLVLEAAPGLLGQGNATVVNQHRSLRHAYEYFRGAGRRSGRHRGRGDRPEARRPRHSHDVQERQAPNACERLPRHGCGDLGVHQPAGA